MPKISFNYAKNTALLIFSVMWSEKDNLLSTITPRSITLLHLSKSMIVLSKVTEYLYLIMVLW